METSRHLAKSLPLSRELLSRKVAAVVRHQIITGQYPDGARLVEDDLATRLGVSRGPVREAFAILERERLVRNTPGKGTYVRALTEESIHQLFAVRTLLEAYAAELAAQRVAAEPEQAEILQALADRLSQAAEEERVTDLAQLDHDIHRKIWELSGNEHLADVLGYLSALAAAIMTLDAETPAELRMNRPRAHQQLVAAVASGDPSVAGAHVREHFAQSQGEVLAKVNLVRSGPDESSAPLDGARSES